MHVSTNYHQLWLKSSSLFIQEEAQARDEASLMTTDMAEITNSKAGSVGVSYTRWGNNRCPKGSESVYSGTMAGTFFTSTGGGANFLCLPEEPDYKSLNTKDKGSISYLYGTEYESPIVGIHDHGVPCAVCYVSGRSAKQMIPAITTCPSGWTREYYGYIMTAHNSHKGRSEFVCIDKVQKSRPGSFGDQNGALLYHVRATCTGIHCPPYDSGKSLTCVMCSK